MVSCLLVWFELLILFCRPRDIACVRIAKAEVQLGWAKILIGCVSLWEICIRLGFQNWVPKPNHIKSLWRVLGITDDSDTSQCCLLYTASFDKTGSFFILQQLMPNSAGSKVTF